MQGPLAAVALRTARMEMNRDKRPMRHFKSNKTLRMSFASTRSLAVGSVRALYDATLTALDRLFRKDRFKNECRYCDEDMDAKGTWTRHELTDTHSQGSANGVDIELIELHPIDQGLAIDLTAQKHLTATHPDQDDRAGSQSRSVSPA